MPERFHRRSIRLKGYDYAQEGAYFLTMCTHERIHLFGQVADGEMVRNAVGDIAQRCWDAIPQHMPHADIDEFIVMPNHVHGIVIIRERLAPYMAGGTTVVGADHDRPLPDPDPPANPTHRVMPIVPHGSLGRIVRAYKSAVTRAAYADGLIPRGTPLWQRNYYERIIRDDASHHRIAQYIAENPRNWVNDDLNR